ncbi:MAG: hypothetical protein A2V98_01560 [Planctomycetes bacterium RBG_16_64_12]|nr:MAG: hypothetical protein A2V98_01560 [Planctomycetes bacterium RBG_16_64_12]
MSNTSKAADATNGPCFARCPSVPGRGPDPSGSETKRHFRGSVLLLGGRVLAILANLVFQVAVVRLLTKSDYGAFAYALSLIVLGATMVGLGLEKSLTRYVPIYQERRDYPRMAGVILIILATIAALGLSFVLVVFGLQGFLARRVVSNPLSLTLLLMLVVLAPLQALDNVLEKMFAIFARPRALFFRRHVLGPGLKLCAVVPLLFFRSNIYVFAAAFVVAGAVGTTYSVVVLAGVLRRQNLLRFFRPSCATFPIGKVFSFSLPLLATDVAFALRTSLGTFLLEFIHGTTGVAAFRAVLPVARLNLMVMDSFKLLFTPTVARLFARGDRAGIDQLYWKNTAWIAVVTFPVFCLTFVSAGPLAVLLFGSRYADSGLVLALLSLGCYLNASFGFNALTLRALGKVRVIVVNDLITAAVAVGLNVLLIPRYGAVGGALAFSATLIVQNVLNQWALFRTGAVSLVEGNCLRIYAVILAVSAALLVIQQVVAPPLAVALLLSAAASFLVLWLSLATLDVEATFPELLRIFGVKKIYAILGGKS